MKIIVLRHGETIWNAKGISQGRVHNRLSKLGEKQAADSREKLVDKDIDIIFTSPLYRTVRTSNIVNKYLNKKIVKDDLIIEMDKGIFSGRLKSSFTEEEKIRHKLRSKEDGMEDYTQVYERTIKFLDKIKKDYSDKTVLVVSHRCVCRLIECYDRFGNYSKENYKLTQPFENAEFREYNI